MLNRLMKIQTWCNGNSVSINTNASEFDHNLMFFKFLRFWKCFSTKRMLSFNLTVVADSHWASYQPIPCH